MLLQELQLLYSQFLQLLQGLQLLYSQFLQSGWYIILVLADLH